MRFFFNFKLKLKCSFFFYSYETLALWTKTYIHYELFIGYF